MMKQKEDDIIQHLKIEIKLKKRKTVDLAIILITEC